MIKLSGFVECRSNDYRRSLCSKAIADPEIRDAQDFLLFSYFKCLLI